MWLRRWSPGSQRLITDTTWNLGLVWCENLEGQTAIPIYIGKKKKTGVKNIWPPKNINLQ